MLAVFCTAGAFAGLYVFREPVSALLNPAPLPSPPALPVPTQALATLPVATVAAPPVTQPAATGTSPALPSTPTPSPAATGVWPPRGQIVYVCFVDGWDQICRMDGDGGSQEQLTFSEATDFYPEWGPLGLLISFSSRRSGEFAIWVMDADGSAPQLTHNAYADWQPHWGE